MIGRSGKRGSGISVLAARHDDDDDDHIDLVFNVNSFLRRMFFYVLFYLKTK